MPNKSIEDLKANVAALAEFSRLVYDTYKHYGFSDSICETMTVNLTLQTVGLSAGDDLTQDEY